MIWILIVLIVAVVAVVTWRVELARRARLKPKPRHYRAHGTPFNHPKD